VRCDYKILVAIHKGKRQLLRSCRTWLANFKLIFMKSGVRMWTCFCRPRARFNVSCSEDSNTVVCFLVFSSLYRLFLALGCFVSINVRWIEIRTEEQTKNCKEYDDYVYWGINFNEVPLDSHSMMPHDNKVSVYPVCVCSLLYNFELLRV
jgi:hypothetical protein